MVIRSRGIKVAMTVFVVSGVAIGWFVERSLESNPPIVLAGSANVYSALTARLPNLANSNQPYLDVPSTHALMQSFIVFDYGRSVGSDERTAFVAMSSNGTDALSAEFTSEVAKAETHLTSDNFWLAILIARHPVFVMYRGISPTDLTVHVASTYPPEGSSVKPSASYHYVRAEDLWRFLSAEKKGEVRLYLPEEKSGTRAIMETAATTRISWPASEQVPRFLNQLLGTTPFLSIQSELQHVHGPAPRPCTLLAHNSMKTAAICTGSEACSGLMVARLTVVLKLARRPSAGNNQFYLANAAECDIARSLTDNVDSDCKVNGIPRDSDHVLNADNAKFEIPEYLTCD
jgi:hypothetical protein